MKSTLFVTGASGFVGRRLLQRLDPQNYETVYCLSRGEASGLPRAPQFQHVQGDLFDAGLYEQALASSDTVIHLAAATGNASAEEHFRVNHAGTRLLLRQSAASGVRRFLYVSSIAAGFQDVRHYPYAQSKRQAENAVQESQLRYAIVRPTIVLGHGSPIGNRLQALGSSALTPLIGSGKARIQPIHVDDLADCLLAIVQTDRFANELLEVGGPEVLTMRALLTRIHQLSHGREPRFLKIPFRPLQAMLALLERLPFRLPVTAGQLSSFANDGIARSNDLVAGQQPGMKGIQQMLERPASRA